MFPRAERSHLPAVPNRHLLQAATLVIATLVLSCGNEPSAPHDIFVEPMQYRDSIFPLAVGNQWAYVDSIYSTQSSVPPYAHIWLASIVSYTEVNNQGIWKCTDRNGSPSISYSIAEDTVYVNDSPLNGARLNPRIAFIPPWSHPDTSTITGPYSWSVTKVYPLGHSLETPAGTFDSVYVYELDLNGKTFTYFRPSVGIICEESSPDDSSYVIKSVLTSYVLWK